MKYNATSRPVIDLKPGDLMVTRFADSGDEAEQFVIRPSAGKALAFDANGLPYAASIIEVIQSSTPLTGATVVMANNDNDGTLVVTPAGTIAALTVTLPTEAASRIGQIERIVTSQTITSLTVNGATTIGGNVTTLTANSFVTFQKVAANTWRRIG